MEFRIKHPCLLLAAASVIADNNDPRECLRYVHLYEDGYVVGTNGQVLVGGHCTDDKPEDWEKPILIRWKGKIPIKFRKHPDRCEWIVNTDEKRMTITLDGKTHSVDLEFADTPMPREQVATTIANVWHFEDEGKATKVINFNPLLIAPVMQVFNTTTKRFSGLTGLRMSIPDSADKPLCAKVGNTGVSLPDDMVIILMPMRL